MVRTIGKVFFHMTWGLRKMVEQPPFEHSNITYGFELTPHQRSDAKFRSLLASDMAKFFDRLMDTYVSMRDHKARQGLENASGEHGVKELATWIV